MKKIIVIIGIVVLISLVGFVTIKTNNSNTEEQVTRSNETTVNLNGTSEATQLDPTDDDAAQKAIEDMVRANEPESTETYSAVVRQDSVERSTTSYGSPKLRYLVDIPQLMRTFIVEREGDINSDFASIYVRCPADTDLKYPAKTCIELE